MTTGGLRLLSVVLTAAGGGLAAVATHRQIQAEVAKAKETAEMDFYRREHERLSSQQPPQIEAEEER